MLISLDGDLPLHLACYDGAAPPEIIRALIDAYPESVRKENRMGLDPLELAARNYRHGSPHRAEVLSLLRWHRPENSEPVATGARPPDETLPGIFTDNPPEQMYSAASHCVVCMEEPSTVAMIPCGHICLCMKCVKTCLRKGRCPVDRCEVHGLYRLQGEQVKIHEAMCREIGDGIGGSQSEIVC